MKYHHSLRTRIIVAFCLFGALMGSTYATIVYICLDSIDDHLVDARLRHELNYFTRYCRQHDFLPHPTSPNISAFMGTDVMPQYVTGMVSGLTKGLHEVYVNNSEYHIAIEELPGQGKTLYLIYDVSALEFTETRKLAIGLVLFGGVFAIVVLGWWIGRLTSQRVIAPVVHLARQVRRSGPGNLPTQISKDFIDDEVGTLAVALEQSMQRVTEFIAREHQFSRDASHELRTPVTVIKGAVELLYNQLESAEDSVLRPLDRIQRQVNIMEQTIEALLSLSREEDPGVTARPFPVLQVVQEVIGENRKLTQGTSVNLDIKVVAEPVVPSPAPLFKIALTNLVRNAMHYTARGHITVTVLKDRIQVSDSGTGINGIDMDLITEPYARGSNSTGFGLGLSIVDRLCQRYGWQLAIQSQAGTGTTAQLIFDCEATKFAKTYFNAPL